MLALYEKFQLKLESTNKKRKELKNQKNISFYLLYSLKAQTLNFSILLIRVLFLLFGDSSENYLIFTRLNKDSVLVCNNSFCVYKKFQKKVRFLSKTAFALIVVTTIITSSFLYFMMPGKPDSFAATYNWNQSNWFGGADTVATANHNTDQNNWTKFYSKDDNVDVSTVGEMKLALTTASVIETTDVDFNAGEQSTGLSGSGDFYIDEGNVYLKKMSGASCTVSDECIGSICDGTCKLALGESCTADTECASNACNVTCKLALGESCTEGTECASNACNVTCFDPWLYTTQCAGIDIYYNNSGNLKWKTSQTDCNTPQCGVDGAQNDDSLVNPISNPEVDFSAYPAQDTCKAIGGRLPTKDELDCIYANRTSIDNVGYYYDWYGDTYFAYFSFWSSVEYSSTHAWYRTLGQSNSTSGWKNFFKTTRCVRTQ